MTHHAPLTLVVGLGNPILSDDSVGWRVVEALRQSLPGEQIAPGSPIKLTEACVGGLALAEMMVGYERVVVIDAMLTGSYAPGTVNHLELKDMPGTLNLASAHDTNLITALDTLRRYGAACPDDGAIQLVAIEALDVWTFSEQCSPQVEASIPVAAAIVRILLGEN